MRLLVICGLLMAMVAPVSAVPVGAGSAIVLTASGLLLTNADAVKDTGRIVVTLEEKTYAASVEQVNAALDVALLRIQATDLVPLPLADPGNIAVNDAIFAAGYQPLSMEGKGFQVVAGKMTTAKLPTAVIFVADVPVHSGNTGGPLLNARGGFVGVLNARSKSHASDGRSILKWLEQCNIPYATSPAVQMDRLATAARMLKSSVALLTIWSQYAPIEDPIERINPIDGARMVFVPGGESTVGVDSLKDENGIPIESSYYVPKLQHVINYRRSFSFPRRKVTLPGFWIYKYEVTLGQWGRFLSAINYDAAVVQLKKQMEMYGYTDQYPCYYVWWHEADAYARWAHAALPTEIQWEKAARGTDERLYPWDNLWERTRCAFDTIYPVGSFKTDLSPYGCFDMGGNVAEWCWGQYEKDDDIPAVIRGGSHPLTAAYCYTTVFRMSGRPVAGYDIRRGFRCVVNLPE